MVISFHIPGQNGIFNFASGPAEAVEVALGMLELRGAEDSGDSTEA